MSKTSVTPLRLAEKYLIKIGLDPHAVNRALLPSLFNDNTICKPLKPHDIVPLNKKQYNFSQSHQTHIYINKDFWPELFDAGQVSSFENTRTSQKTKQDIVVFEGNISHLLTRRSRKFPLPTEAYTTPKTYAGNSSQLMSTSTCKKLFYQSNVQVHIGIEDDQIFKDFRHGILENDYLMLFKYANRDCLLAIAVPAEYCSKFIISGTAKINRRAYAQTTKEKSVSDMADLDYSTEANSSSVVEEITPLAPAPAPGGSARRSSSKPKYKGKPSRGKGALSKAAYTCEWDASHTTFISNTTGENYMEPHHMIPISMQGLYSSDIDITSNLICLCPNCHKRIHLGKKVDVEPMLRKFFADRESDLKTCGIDIDIYTLLAYYDI